MPIRHAIWKVSAQPEQLTEAQLPSEQLLETMICAAPRILSDQWMLIGRQEDTGFGGRIDLLALAPDGALVLIELKRNRTPREVVAQAIDYASWVQDLWAEDIAAIYSRYAPSRDLASDFRVRFGQALDEDTLNQSHQIIIVAASIDASTERIVKYLNERGIALNVLCFQVFDGGSQQLISRAWLLDPAQTQVSAASSPAREKEPWNGEFYASFGVGAERSWEEASKYGFISAGGGTWYSNTLNLLRPGDRLWVKAPGKGFVGVGRAAGPAEPLLDFELDTPEGRRPALEVLQNASYLREAAHNLDQAEWFVPIAWEHTVPLPQAVNEIGLFGNQNTVCKPTTPKWRQTVERLKAHWGVD